MRCSLLLTQLSDVKQDEMFLASDPVVRRKERCSLLLTQLSDVKQDEMFLASDLVVRCKAR
jgi:hypothetical protein